MIEGKAAVSEKQIASLRTALLGAGYNPDGVANQALADLLVTLCFKDATRDFENDADEIAEHIAEAGKMPLLKLTTA